MRVLVVFESVFGNTGQVAEAVADGLATAARVDVVEVGSAPSSIGAGVDLLVVGAPTHALSLSSPKSRRSAAAQTAIGPVTEETGVREWLAALELPIGETLVAAFDTRIARPRIPGSAARAALRRLRRKGFKVLTAAKSFYVSATSGPLVPDELSRARRWGSDLAAELGARPV